LKVKVKTGLGLDSHRFVEGDSNKPLLLGGVEFEDAPPLAGNSDADVILHAITDAISGITGFVVIGSVADGMCRHGIVDSREYLKVALESLGIWRLTHVSIALECQRPLIAPRVPELRASISELLGLEIEDVCITATSGERLTDVGRGLGIHASVIATAIAHDG
jgi:2-C-methyl-D-erythritol 2,4-cyclodiphosphate synthase